MTTEDQSGEIAEFASRVRRGLDILSRRHVMEVSYLVHDSPRRFNELRDLLGINPKSLSAALKGMQEIGMIERHDLGGLPPHVEYRFSARAHGLGDVLMTLDHWIKELEDPEDG